MGVFKKDRYREGSRVQIVSSPYTESRHIVGLEMVIASRPNGLSEKGVLEVRMPEAPRTERSEYVRPTEVVELGD
jgi:hypothetical protein